MHPPSKKTVPAKVSTSRHSTIQSQNPAATLNWFVKGQKWNLMYPSFFCAIYYHCFTPVELSFFTTSASILAWDCHGNTYMHKKSKECVREKQRTKKEREVERLFHRFSVNKKMWVDKNSFWAKLQCWVFWLIKSCCWFLLMRSWGFLSEHGFFGFIILFNN